MFYKKKGVPEESEIVLCTVKKVLYHSVFVILDEYENLEGMIHISEISPGRIRNIRDFVKEGKKIVCKILRVNKAKNHIDLSLRRVSVSVRKKKNEEYKQAQKAEKILENLAKKQKTTMAQIYKDFGYKLIEEFDSLNEAFQAVVAGKTELKNIVTEKIRPTLIKLIKEKIKPPEVAIEGTLNIESPQPNGIEIIKDSIKKIQTLSKNKKYKLNISYLGAPKYKLSIKASHYKEAEAILKEILNEITKDLEKNKSSISFKR